MFSFTFRQLEVFLSLCRTASFRQTAEEFGISQPAVSRLISMLEAQTGKTLFVRRSGAAPTLSAEGITFRRDLDLFIEYGRKLDGRGQPAAQHSRPVSLFVGPHLADDYVMPRLSGFGIAHPGIELRFIPLRPRVRLYNDIRNHKIDIAFLTVRKGELQGEGVTVISEVCSGVYAHRRYWQPEMSPEAISDLPFILPLPGTDEEAVALSSLKNLGIVPRAVILRSQLYNVRRQMTVDGMGATFTLDTIMQSATNPDVVLLAGARDREQVLYINPALDHRIARTVGKFLENCLV